jgi:hypothetical protein
MCDCEWRSGRDSCQEEIVDARPGVKYGCDDVAADVTDVDEVVEICEPDERVDREDMIEEHESCGCSVTI